MQKSTRRPRLSTMVMVSYAMAAGAIALVAGAEAGPMFGQRGNGVAVGVQAMVTAAVAIPAGYFSDSLVSWLVRQLSPKPSE